MQRSPSPAASACSSHTAGGSSRRSGDKSMQKTKRKPPAFGGMATRSDENKEDWRWAVAQIEQQIDGAGASGIAGLAGAPSQPTLDDRMQQLGVTPPRAPPAAACVSALSVPR